MKEEVLVDLNIKLISDEGNQIPKFKIDWSPVGRSRIKHLVIGLCSGQYLNALLAAIEHHNSNESVELVREIESYYSDGFKDLNEMLTEALEKMPEKSGDIPPSEAMGGQPL